MTSEAKARQQIDEMETSKAGLLSAMSAVELALKRSTAQRQDILRAAFTGPLVPQDPNDEPASVLLARIRAEWAAQGAGKKTRGRTTQEASA